MNNSISDRMSGMASGKMAGSEEPEMDGEEKGGDVKEHLMKMHAKMGGTHSHLHSDGMSHASHHVSEDGQHSGPHEHESADAMAEHTKKMHGGEEQNGDTDPYPVHRGGNQDLMG